MVFHYKGPAEWRISDEHYKMLPKSGTGPLVQDAQNGAIRIPKNGFYMQTFFSLGMGWEHVSTVARLSERLFRTPTWNEMCEVKDLFWDDEDAVVQFHPPRSQYVNVHPNVLHLWKPAGKSYITPPMELIG